MGKGKQEFGIVAGIGHIGARIASFQMRHFMMDEMPIMLVTDRELKSLREPNSDPFLLNGFVKELKLDEKSLMLSLPTLVEEEIFMREDIVTSIVPSRTGFLETPSKMQKILYEKRKPP